MIWEYPNYAYGANHKKPKLVKDRVVICQTHCWLTVPMRARIGWTAAGTLGSKETKGKHWMLVDPANDALGRIAQNGSAEVTKYKGSGVLPLYLTSVVKGQLLPD